MTCPNCGKETADAAGWCAHCGHQLSTSEAESPAHVPATKKPSLGWVAGLLIGLVVGFVYAIASGAVNFALIGNFENPVNAPATLRTCGPNLVVAAVQLAVVELAVGLLTRAGRWRLFGADRGERLAEFWTSFVFGLCCPFLPCSVFFSLSPLVKNCGL